MLVAVLGRDSDLLGGTLWCRDPRGLRWRGLGWATSGGVGWSPGAGRTLCLRASQAIRISKGNIEPLFILTIRQGNLANGMDNPRSPTSTRSDAGALAGCRVEGYFSNSSFAVIRRNHGAAAQGRVCRGPKDCQVLGQRCTARNACRRPRSRVRRHGQEREIRSCTAR